jgi:hypothetical protein
MKRHIQRLLIGLALLMLFALSACSPAQTPAPTTTPSPTHAPPTSTPSATPTITETQAEEDTLTASTSTPAPTATNTPDLRLKPENWQNWPIIPDVSPTMKTVYEEGLAMGNDPHTFSVIGDCQSSPTYFLSIYDEGRYTLTEEQAYLQETIDWYSGSFEHRSLTVKNGMTAPGALNPLWADPEVCDSKETPIECELRVSNPSLVLISLGTNWNPDMSQEKYIAYLTQIVEILIEHGVVPVLSTKADNAEGDYSRNLAITQVAYDLEIPLWNFWAAVEGLSNRGLDKDRENVYLNHQGWDVRNESALYLLDQLRQELNTK